MILSVCGSWMQPNCSAAAAAEPATALRQLIDDEWAARLRDDPLFATQSAVRDYDALLPIARVHAGLANGGVLLPILELQIDEYIAAAKK